MKISQPWVLSIDRTTWEFGCHVYNILTIGVVHEGVAFPVLWWMLNKKGNSNRDERMRVIEELLKLFPDAPIKCLCADREFIGQAGLRYLLLEPSMPFRLRIRATDKIERNGTLLVSKVVFAHLQGGQSQALNGQCQVWGYPVSVEALRLEDGRLLVVIGSLMHQRIYSVTMLCGGGLKIYSVFSRRVAFALNRLISLTQSAYESSLRC
jgi:hypothetical protein